MPKPMKLINELKRDRIKKILNELKKPMTFGEILDLFKMKPMKTTNRTIHNYLAELRAYGLIEYNEEFSTYQLSGIKKRVFKNDSDKQSSIRHARHLVLSSVDGTKQRLDNMSDCGVDVLVFNNENHVDYQLNEDLKQHIKTGYFEIYKKIQAYRKLIKQKNEYTSEEILQEIDSLKGILKGMIKRRIIRCVEEGQPLCGECKNCPHKTFSVSN